MVYAGFRSEISEQAQRHAAANRTLRLDLFEVAVIHGHNQIKTIKICGFELARPQVEISKPRAFNAACMGP